MYFRHYLPPMTLREDNVFTGVCLSRGGGGVGTHPWAGAVCIVLECFLVHHYFWDIHNLIAHCRIDSTFTIQQLTFLIKDIIIKGIPTPSVSGTIGIHCDAWVTPEN